MTRDQEKSIMANLETALITPPRRWVRRVVIAVAIIVGCYGYYFHSTVADFDATVVRSLRLWDKTEALIASNPYSKRLTASCEQARSYATRLADWQAKTWLERTAELEMRVELSKSLAKNAQRCVRDMI